MSNITNLPASYNGNLPVPSLEAYIAQVNQIPILDRAEEIRLAERMQCENDREAAQLLILSHLRYVVRVAKSYMGYGLSLADLIQEGTIGLMKAVKRFDYKKEVRLVTFAMHWIKAEIHEFIIKNWRIMKVATTKAQRKLFFKLKSAKKSVNWLTNEEAQIIAKDLGVKSSEVFKMEQRLLSKDVPFELPYDEHTVHSANSNKQATAPIHYLEVEEANPALMLEHANWQTDLQDKLQTSIAQLDPRSQEIIQKRWLAVDNKATLAELAENFNISKERVRQLEQQALGQLKQAIYKND